MKLLITTALVACTLFLNAQVENGCISIDFETFPNETPASGLVLSDQYKDAFGLSFRLEGGGFPVLAQVGGNSAEAFGSAWGNDTPAPGVDIGQFFLTDDGQLSGLTSPAIILDFEIPIDSFAGCILDMDFEEFFIIQALDEFGQVILEERIDAGDPDTGDGALTCWGFNLPGCEGSIYSIKYAGFRPASSPGAFGLGMDFFSFCYSGLQIDTETTPVTCDALGSVNIFSTTNEVYEYSLDGVTYTLDGFFDQLDQGVQTIYVRDSDDCTTTVDVNIALDEDDLPAPIFVSEEICEGQSFVFNGEEYFDEGMYQQTLAAVNGCDTLWNLTLSVVANSMEFVDAEICEGENFVLNGEIYSMAGVFQQELNTFEGCDSIIELSLIVNANTNEFINAEICDGETFDLNGQTYAIGGSYTQSLSNVVGCDSIIELDLIVNSNIEVFINAEICEGASYDLNGQVYTMAGNYIQSLSSSMGCDSIITLELELSTISTTVLSREICEGDDVTINGVLYDTPGAYSQTLVNAEGCDSLLDIRIDFLPSIEVCESITIFEGEVYNLNGQTYTAAGTYQQMFQTTDGCDSLVIIKLDVVPLPIALVHYNLDDCAAGGASYDEFEPQYGENLECAQLVASLLNRPSGLTHSCTPGEIGSGMCVSSDSACAYSDDSEHKLVFDVFVAPTSEPVLISGIRFFEKAPERYEYNAGGTGLNNYPTLYSLKVLKDGDVIYFEEAIATNREWTQQTFGFNGLDAFVFDEPGNLTVEFLAYCPVGIPSNVSAWDIDELSLFGFCQPESNKVVGNIMTTRLEPLSEVTVAIKEGDFREYHTSDANGDFAFETPYDQTSAVIEPRKNDDPLNGVTTLDLIHIQRHVLGLQPLENFTDFVAADINKDDKIDVLDLLELRKLLLGIYDDFPRNTSWRFIDAEKRYNLLSDVDDQMKVRTAGGDIQLEGIKIGDVNQSYILRANKPVLDSRAQSNFKFEVKEYLNDNEELTFGFFASADFDMAGFQAAFKVGDLTGVSIVSHELTIGEQDYNLDDDDLKISWSSQNQKIEKGQLLFEILCEVDESVGGIQFSPDAQNEIYDAVEMRVHNLILESVQDNLSSDDSIQFNSYPNPFRDQMKVQIFSKDDFTTQYELIDISGRLIKSNSVHLTKGVNEIDFKRETFPNTGIYFLKIQYKDSVFIERIVLM